MFWDENFKIYAAALLIAGAGVTVSFVSDRPTLEIAGFFIEDPMQVAQGGGGDTSAIETASIAPPRDSPAGADAWGAPEVPWRDFEAGSAEMRRTGRSGVMVLQSDWCLECEAYQEQWRRADVAAFGDELVFILVDVDAEPAVQERYALDGDYVPRTIVLSPDGRPRFQRSGGHPAMDFFVETRSPDELLSLLSRARRD